MISDIYLLQMYNIYLSFHKTLFPDILRNVQNNFKFYEQRYYISQLICGVWLVNFAGCISLYGP